jgi:DNA ligase (NAD+)
MKFTPREQETTIEEIVVQVGRTGILTPVARLTPVNIGGVTVKRATLHNREEVARKDVRVGDRVRVVRAGDVIPDVVARVPRRGERRGRPFVMPPRCPECGTALVHEGPFDRCPNGLACPAQLRGAIQHFASRDALDIRGLGRETVDRLVSRKLVHSVADLFVLTEDDLRRLEGFGAISARKLVAALARARRTELSRFVYALGIPGLQTARDLERHVGRLVTLQASTEKELQQVRGVGPAAARAIATFFGTRENRETIASCLSRGLEIEAPARTAARGPLTGKTVVFTGGLPTLTRHAAAELVAGAGGRVATSVSRQTDLVVAGADPGAKLARAKRLGVRIVEEKELLTLVGR